jgi:phosphoenolpyruvate carboxykinase (GTP)
MTTSSAGTKVIPEYARLRESAAEVAKLAEPDQIHWADGSAGEHERICAEMVASGMLIRRNPAKRPNCYLAWADPSDVARGGSYVHAPEDSRSQCY